MAKRLDKIIVVDVESTCWDGEPPPGQQSEIIEVGVCLVDVAGATVGESESLIVRPETSRVSGFCTGLTTLTQEQADRGMSFRDACSRLKKRYDTKVRPWASYGDYDRRQFERQCAARGVGFPFGPTHINVKNLFAVSRALPREVGMSDALAGMELPLLGTHHRGVDDARNIAAILAELLRRMRT